VSREFSKISSLATLFAALIGCGPAIHDYRVVQLPSGRILKVLSVGEVPLEGGGAGLRLAYETDLAPDDRPALYREVEAIWDEFRFRESAAGASAVVVVATTPEASGWSRERAAIEYSLRLGPGGGWQFASAGDAGSARSVTRRPQ
jgi:hypothetical protein